MHPLLKRLALLVPSLRRVARHLEAQQAALKSAEVEAEQLRGELAELSAEEKARARKHHPYTKLNARLGVSKGSGGDDKRIVERLLQAYRTGSADQYGSTSAWRDIFDQRQRHLHDIFMRGDLEQSRQALADPASNDLFYGFDELCAEWSGRILENPNNLVSQCQDNLLRLAEALGSFRVDNAETDRWLANVALPTDDVLKAIDQSLGVAVVFPDVFRNAVGVQSERGVVTYRAVQALYLAHRLREIAIQERGTVSFSICEIGAGLGRSAFYARLLGLADCTLVDVPMTVISQGYYLMRCLGEDAVVLPGEKRRDRSQIRLMHASDFFALDERFDLVVNVDSLTEFGEELATRYLRKIATATPLFLSINHEANEIRVFDLLKALEVSHVFSRHPYWMRQGYAEELVRFTK